MALTLLAKFFTAGYVIRKKADVARVLGDTALCGESNMITAPGSLVLIIFNTITHKLIPNRPAMDITSFLSMGSTIASLVLREFLHSTLRSWARRWS